MYVTMVDHVLVMLESGEILAVFSMNKKGTTNKVFDMMSAKNSRQV